jgi:hypothetical protein
MAQGWEKPLALLQQQRKIACCNMQIAENIGFARALSARHAS